MTQNKEYIIWARYKKKLHITNQIFGNQLIIGIILREGVLQMYESLMWFFECDCVAKYYITLYLLSIFSY